MRARRTSSGVMKRILSWSQRVFHALTDVQGRSRASAAATGAESSRLKCVRPRKQAGDWRLALVWLRIQYSAAPMPQTWTSPVDVSKLPLVCNEFKYIYLFFLIICFSYCFSVFSRTSIKRRSATFQTGNAGGPVYATSRTYLKNLKS